MFDELPIFPQLEEISVQTKFKMMFQHLDQVFINIRHKIYIKGPAGRGVASGGGSGDRVHRA